MSNVRKPLLEQPSPSASRGNGRTGVSTSGRGGEMKPSWDTDQPSYQGVDHRYLAAVDTFQKDLRRLEILSSSIKRGLDEIGTARESSRGRADLTRQVAEGKNLIKSATTTAREISSMKPPADRSERANRQVEVQKFTKDLQDRVSTFQKVAQAVESREREAARDERHKSSVGSDGEHSEEEDNRVRFRNMQQVEFNETIIEERAEAISAIHSSVVEVNELFRDIATLVDDQQRDIDNVELNITEAHTKTEDGVKQLNQAMEHQKKARGKIIGLLIVAIVIAVIVGTVVGLKVKKK